MESVPIETLLADLASLLARVEAGQAIRITRDGAPVAVLAPPRRILTHEEAVDQLREFRKGRTLGDVTVKELIEEGRRY